MHQLRGSAVGQQGLAEFPPSLGRNQDIFSYKFSRDLSKSRRDLSGFCRRTLWEQRGSSASTAGLGGAEPSVPGDSRGHGAGPSPWPPSHSSEPTGLHPGHSLGLPTLFQRPAGSGVYSEAPEKILLSSRPPLRAHRTALPPEQIFHWFPKLFH